MTRPRSTCPARSTSTPARRRCRRSSPRAVTGRAAREMDLLTVVMHELGHVIGLDSRYDGDTSDLMYVYLGTGERRLPTAADLPVVAAPEPTAVGWVESSRPTDRKGKVGL